MHFNNIVSCHRHGVGGDYCGSGEDEQLKRRAEDSREESIKVIVFSWYCLEMEVEEIAVVALDEM